MNEVGRFAKDNFDKLLLALIFFGAVVLVVHLTHDQRDADLILWAREQAGTVLGALLGLITGHALAQRQMMTATTDPPKVTTTTETQP